MRIKKLLAFFLSMSFIVCSLPTLVSADEVDGAGSADDPVVEDVGDSSDPEAVAGAPADVKQGENGSGEVKKGSGEVESDSGAVRGDPVVGGQNDNDGGSGDTVYSGTCGVGVSWNYDPSTYTLSITGFGDMEDYPNNDDMPWLNIRQDITTVHIGYGVISVGDRAFFQCYKLTSVIIADSVEDIGHSAFANCRELGSVALSKNLSVIGKYAFSTCGNLSKIVIPNSVITIGENAFSGCASLTEIIIPNSVKTIKEFAFAGTAIKEVTIPDSVINTSGFLFDYCNQLTRIECFADPANFEFYTFDNLEKDTYVYVPHKYFGNYCSLFPYLGDQLVDIETNEHGAAQPTSTGSPINTDTPITGTPVRDIKASGNCGSGVNWILYKDGELFITGYGSVNDYSETDTPWDFYCNSITSVTIDTSVKEIGSCAFKDFIYMRTITIPENVKILGDNVFQNCNRLDNIYCYADPGSFSGNAFAKIDADYTIIHVKTRYCKIYESKYLNLCIIDDLSYVDLLGNTVVLSDQIGVNFYLDYSKYINISDLSVEFKWGKGSNAKTVSGTFSQTSDYDAKCITSCSVPARCMTDSIKMTVKKRDDIVISSTFKIAKYANDLAELYPAVNVDTSDYIGLEKNGKLHTLLIAMLNYGAESQKYFNYNTDDLANAKKYTKNLVTVGSVSSSTKSAYSNYDEAKTGLISAKNTIANIGDDNIGLAYDGSAVACKSKLSVRIYFTKTEGFDMSNLSASYKGKALTFKEDGDSVYLQIDGMSPKAYAPKGSDLFDCGLTININGKDYTYTYLDYVQKCVATENGFEDTAVALAVYSYFAANY